MKLGGVSSDDTGIEDVRGGGGGGVFGGLGGLPLGKGGKIGIPALLIAVVSFFISQSGGGGGSGAIGDVLGQLSGAQTQTGQVPQAPGGAKDAQYKFVSQVKNLLDDYWAQSFESSDKTFKEPGVVIFDAPTNTGGCGIGQPEAGPFYCPGDSKIYIDFGFYEQLEKQLGFGGDFAMAYVIAHEYGHHIQNLLGVSREIQERQSSESESEANKLSVKVELQADCFAGAWGHSALKENRLSDGDIDEALDAASAVGDDKIQAKTQGRVDRESFTHGSAAERQKWFKSGFDTGDPSKCDTFA